MNELEVIRMASQDAATPHGCRKKILTAEPVAGYVDMAGWLRKQSNTLMGS